MTTVLLPAYGRRYETESEMLQAWKDGKDFHIYNGPYCSIRDVEIMQLEYGIDHVILQDRHLVVDIDF